MVCSLAIVRAPSQGSEDQLPPRLGHQDPQVVQDIPARHCPVLEACKA